MYSTPGRPRRDVVTSLGLSKADSVTAGARISQGYSVWWQVAGNTPVCTLMLHITQIYVTADFNVCLTDTHLFYRLKMEAGLEIGVIFHILIQTLQQFMSWQEVLPGPYLSDLSCDFPSSHCMFHRRLPTAFLHIWRLYFTISPLLSRETSLYCAENARQRIVSHAPAVGLGLYRSQMCEGWINDTQPPLT